MTPEQKQAMVEHARALQGEEHPVHPFLNFAWDGDTFCLALGGRLQPITPEQALAAIEGRALAIRKEKEDPLHYGHEPDFWHETDWAMAERRVACPGTVLELYVLGGNRAAKTEFAAKRSIEMLVENKEWLVWGLHSDENSSRAIQQKRVYKYLPPEYRTESGKLKKTKTTKLSYNELSGFTENSFSLPNGSQWRGKFYSADVKAVEGDELDGAWSDELIPLDWVEAISFRLLTKAQFTRTLVADLRDALAERAAGRMERLPAALRARLYRGVHIITFTPVLGWTPTVGRALTGARTIRDEEAEILPHRDRHGRVMGFQRVPRVQVCKDPTRFVVYFHTKDNVFGGNWEGMKVQLANATERTKKVRAYGVPSQTMDARFPLFSETTHCRPLERLPREGTWYHIVDPCPGRNYFMIWVKVNALGEHFVAREWPQEGDYIPGVGYPGEWTTPSTGSRKDGDRGPAQTPFGFGLQQYVDEIERVERELWQAENPGAAPGASGRIPVYLRIMDSRAANTPSLGNTAAETLSQKFLNEFGLEFVPAGRDSGAEQGTTSIKEGIDLVNNLLWYDEKATKIDDGVAHFGGKAPSLYVCADCKNTIFALTNWTGADGLKGACKDPIDVVRYYTIAGPEDVSGTKLNSYNPYEDDDDDQTF